MEQWSEKLNVPLPECGKCGICCLCATPSVSYKKLLEKAAEGDKFARDFFSIFIPYKSHDEARKISEELVERTIKACKDGSNDIPLEDLVFYRCRYYHFEKKCRIYEERPELCRVFPGSPYTILHKDCAFYDWAQECKKVYNNFKAELEELKKKKKEMEIMKEQKRYEDLLYRLKNLKDEEYRFMLTLPSLCIVSPAGSWLKFGKSYTK